MIQSQKSYNLLNTIYNYENIIHIILHLIRANILRSIFKVGPNS